MNILTIMWITQVLLAPIGAIVIYKTLREQEDNRRLVLVLTTCATLFIAFVPIIGSMAYLGMALGYIINKIGRWINNDPSNNDMEEPVVEIPVIEVAVAEEQEQSEPINSRNEILDIRKE